MLMSDDGPKTSVPKLGQPLSFFPAFETTTVIRCLLDWSWAQALLLPWVAQQKTEVFSCEDYDGCLRARL
jgi:hypothetical protein